MLLKTLLVLNLAEPKSDIYYYSSDSTDSVNQLGVLLLTSSITSNCKIINLVTSIDN